VIRTSRSKIAEGYREIDIIFAALHQDLAEHLARPSDFGGARDPFVASETGKPVMASNIRQRVLAKVVAEANELLRDRGVPEILECTPHTLRRTYISLLLAAGCDPAYVQQQVGHTDPTLTLRIYQQLLKRKRREEYRARVNELLGTSPAALSRLPEPAHRAAVGPRPVPVWAWIVVGVVALGVLDWIGSRFGFDVASFLGRGARGRVRGRRLRQSRPSPRRPALAPRPALGPARPELHPNRPGGRR
jgi:integrase-like protein